MAWTVEVMEVYEEYVGRNTHLDCMSMENNYGGKH